MFGQAGNGVFDMSQFTSVGQHPGGPDAITRNCGQQVTDWVATDPSHAYYVYVCMGLVKKTPEWSIQCRGGVSCCHVSLDCDLFVFPCNDSPSIQNGNDLVHGSSTIPFKASRVLLVFFVCLFIVWFG